MRVSVVGGSTVTETEADLAREVGAELARRGHTLVCGGLGGAMRAACEGAGSENGHTVGILPGTDPAAANPYVETAVATGMGPARNYLVVLNGQATIAVDGGPGTLSEIAHTLVLGRPVAGLGTHDVDGVRAVETPAVAVDHVERAVE